MLVLAGHLKTSPHLVADLAAALRALVEPTLREPGCLAYHFALDDPAAGTVLVYERWSDEAALAAHLGQPAVQELLGGWVDRIDISGVRKFDAANERGFTD
ncbi:putative quinol monooxygenase [Novosphingobium gossypii]|uniref:putative quinol monooxygenase n=1 Tax=Novosphingobium gossypii TaxID=1604774 RepID=UPI003D2069D9